MTPIQLTDLIAYEHRLTFERQRQQSERPFRTSFLEIRRMLPIEEVLLPGSHRGHLEAPCSEEAPVRNDQPKPGMGIARPAG